MRALILQLEAPLMAFGAVAVDERMPVQRFPALSMVAGLIANAMGLRRTEGARIQEIQDAMEIASRVDRPGHLLRDYQTALLNSKDEVWTSFGVRSGRDGGASGDFTVQMWKEYWSDASVLVAVALPDICVDEAAQALREPARPLFLGRASCPPSCPILVSVQEATDVLDAISIVPAVESAQQEVLAQWPARLGRTAASRMVRVSDLKDWRNGTHAAVREVSEGKIILRQRLTHQLEVAC